jgi:predicted nucleotidyltransferase
MGTVREACPEWAQNIVLVGYRGSESHGTSIREGETATDDVDVFAVSVQPEEWYVGLGGYTNGARQVHETAGDYLDLLVYDVRKFFHLLAKGNPNVHVFLWLRGDHYLHETAAGRKIIEARESFLSASVLDALCGYATAQFKKMERNVYRGYMGEKRKALTDRFGYDVKNAAHCLRPRKERELLMEVKRGEWSLEQVKQWADALWRRYRSVESDAELPDYPDYPAINRLLVDVICSEPSP